MKNALFLLSLILSATINAQTTAAVIQLPNSQILYRGYDNEVSVQIVNLQSRKVNVYAKNASITTEEPGKYIVRPGAGKNTLIGVNCVDEDSTFFIGQQYYKVYNLPDPTLYLGGKKESTYIVGEARTLSAAYPKELGIDAEVEVRSWIVYSGDQKVSGKGSEITGIDELISSMREGGPLTIRATVVGPDGILRRLTGCWFVG